MTFTGCTDYKVLDEADRNYQHQTNYNLPVYCDRLYFHSSGETYRPTLNASNIL